MADDFTLKRCLFLGGDFEGGFHDLPVAVAGDVTADRPVFERGSRCHSLRLKPASVDASRSGEVQELGAHEIATLKLLDSLGYVEGLRATRDVQPCDAVANLEASILHREIGRASCRERVCQSV